MEDRGEEWLGVEAGGRPRMEMKSQGTKAKRQT